MHELLKDRTVFGRLVCHGLADGRGSRCDRKNLCVQIVCLGLWLDDSRGDLGREI